MAICLEKRPMLSIVGKGHKARCWLYEDSGIHSAPFKYGRYNAEN
jgi:hypothetical protein